MKPLFVRAQPRDVRNARLRRFTCVVEFLALLFLACDGNSPAWLGFTDRGAAQPLAIDIVCDESSGATCTRKTLTEVLDEVLPLASERPGSTVGVWLQGSDVATTSLAAQVS